MTDKITSEFLESIGIFELREIGREIGVHSPTTLKRDVLAKKIIDIYEGKIKPITRNNRGRPVKATGNTKVVVSNVKNQAELNYDLNETDKSVLMLKEPETDFDTAIEENLQCAGFLDILEDGCGMIRVKNYSQNEQDVYISRLQVVAFNLKTGDLIQGVASKNPEKKYRVMHTVLSVNDVPIVNLRQRKNFEELTPVYPDKKLISFSKDNPPDINILGLTAPLGKGQRAVVFAPDKFKKTEFLKKLSGAIKKNDDSVKVLTLLLDEFPEEITEIKRAVIGEIVYTTFDEQPNNNIKTSELVLERAKRLTESGKDVVLVINNLNTLARAYSFNESKNSDMEQSYHLLRRFFGAARNMDEGGSLSIIAFVNSNTDIAFDSALCKELKGVGNSEIYLAKESDSGVLIDIINSDTIKKELILTKEEFECGKTIKTLVETNYNDIKKIIPIIEGSCSVKELKEKLNK